MRLGRSGAFNRRDCLLHLGGGIGGLALLDLLMRDGALRCSAAQDRPAPRAKSVIYLYMSGGPSHLDTFDPKPRLLRDHGKPMPMSVVGRFSSNKVMASPYTFAQYGQSGTAISDVFPHLAQQADRLTVVRSMVAEHMEHPTANTFMITGSSLRGRASLGSWVLQGLGSETESLPGYVVLWNDAPQGGLELFGNGFLPASARCSLWDMRLKNPVGNIAPGDESFAMRPDKLELLTKLNNLSFEQFGQSDRLAAAAANYDLAFRMQSSVPELLDDREESQQTRRLYGLDDPGTLQFGRQCLLARRLVERGVRFVVLLPPTVPGANSWDQHNNLAENLRGNALLVDKPMAGLLADLSNRGLLDETLVMWGGEFGRTPMAELSDKPPGREHNPHGFTMWFAGGGMKPGTTYGATDEFGYAAVEKPVTVHDLHATILHLLGIDHTQLTYHYAGRDFRLTDVYGRVVSDLLA